jgi:hypothetical protein
MAERTIADVARALQKYSQVRGKKLDIGEHPEFGGVGAGHSPTGYHPVGQAIDVRDWRDDIGPAYEGGKPKSWKERTGELRWRAKQLGVFNEVLGPGDPGHDTHVHLALAGKKYITDPQLEWLATGRYKTAEGKLSDILPGADLVASTQQQQEGGSSDDLSTLLSLLQLTKPKQKTLQESLLEQTLGEALTPKPSMTQQFLMEYMNSPLPGLA